jgi:hypothetical protein
MRILLELDSRGTSGEISFVVAVGIGTTKIKEKAGT